MSKEVLSQGCTLEEEIRTGEGWLERINIVIVPSPASGNTIYKHHHVDFDLKNVHHSG